MASLKEAAEQLTGQLEELVERLRSELTDGDVDFEKLGGIADEIGSRADGLAQTFGDINDTLMKRIEDVLGGGSDEQEQGGGEGGDQQQQKAGSRQGGGEGK
jgi:hypothetical protein